MRDIDAARSIPPSRGLAADAEHLLWFYLRGRQLADCVFRRRHAIGPQVADFACLERRLCLVIDAGGEDVAPRAAFLKARGFTVCKLEFRRVFEDTEQLLDEIGEALAADASRCASARSQAARLPSVARQQIEQVLQVGTGGADAGASGASQLDEVGQVLHVRRGLQSQFDPGLRAALEDVQ